MLVQFVFQLKVLTDTILCNFTAVFHVVCRCFIIGRRSVENLARLVNFSVAYMVTSKLVNIGA